METRYTQYHDEYGVTAMIYDPDNSRAWIRSSATTVVEQ